MKLLLGGRTSRRRGLIEIEARRLPLLEIRLPAAPEAAEIARAAIDRLSSFAGHGERSFDLRLLASELIANAVQHGAGPETTIRLSLAELGEHRLRVEVEDEGPGFTAIPVKPASHEQTSGRGLRLLSALADRWGIERTPRTRVWFELDLAAPRRTPQTQSARTTPQPRAARRNT